MFAPPLGGRLHPLHRLVDVLLVDRRSALGGQVTTRGAERGDGVQQPVLGVGRQIAEQAFGAPRRRLVRVEAGLLQRGGPVEAQVDGHRPAVDGGLGADVGQRPGLELDHLRLVHLIYDGAGRPLQPVCARIQAGRQDHHLPDARGRRVGEEVVEELGPDRHVVDHPVHAGVGIVIDVERGGSNSPVASRVNTSTPTARTRGSAYGSLINAPSILVTIARAAATIVAVAPTLEARSHVSFSVRAIE